MAAAFATLVVLQLLGAVLRSALHLPLPAPLIGMALLTLLLVARGSAGPAADRAVPPPLRKLADALIANLGLLFVPAGVGIVTEVSVLQQDWLPILAGLVVSTVLGVAVTGLVMHHVSRIGVPHRQAVPAGAGE
jgi:holin-like protein